MKSYLLFATLAVTSAFAPVAFAPRTSTAVNIFGAFGGGNKKPAASKEKENFLGGKGAKITVREDEDAAMWIDEPKKDTKKPAPKKK